MLTKEIARALYGSEDALPYLLKFMQGTGGSLPWQTFTGNPVQFDAPKAHTLRSTVVAFSPKQEGSGDPSPQNIRSISGWNSIDVVRAGENLWDTSKAYDGPNYSTAVGDTISLTETVLGYSVSGNTISFTATGSWQGIVFKTPYLKAGNYNLHCSLSDGFRGKTFAVGADNKVKEVKFIAYATTNLNYTVGEGDFLCVWFGRATAGDLTVTDYQIELGSSFTEWHEPKPISTTTLSFPTTVYGGTAEVAEDGSVTLTLFNKKVSITAFNGVFGATTNGYCAYRVISDSKKARYTDAVYMASNIFTFSPTSREQTPLYGYGGNDGASTVLTFILPSTITSLEEANAWLVDNPTEITYMLATPIVITLPSVEALKALKGINTMWTDADSLEATARANTVQLNALQSLNMLLGGRYVNNHTEKDLTDEEALDIILGGQR